MALSSPVIDISLHFVAAQVKSSALCVMPMDSAANIFDSMDFVSYNERVDLQVDPHKAI